MIALVLGTLPTSVSLLESTLDHYGPSILYLCGSRELNSKARTWAWESYRPYRLSDTDIFRDPIPNLVLVFDSEGCSVSEIIFSSPKKVSD